MKVRLCLASIPVCALALTHASLGQSFELTAELTPSDGPFENYGTAVAVEGDTLVVGDKTNPGNDGFAGGAAYVYRQTPTGWVEEQKIVPADNETFDGFGSAAAIQGDTLFISAMHDSPGGNHSAGAVYIFERIGSEWTQVDYLAASDAGHVHRFGVSIAIDGDTLLVGADAANGALEGTGAAYVFVRDGSTWTEQAKLRALDGRPLDYFGRSVALSGDTAIAGAYRHDEWQGAAWIFQRNGSEWQEQAKLVATEAAPFHQAGNGVGLEGDVAVVGAPFFMGAGGAFVYERNGTTWTQAATLEATGSGGGYGRTATIENGQLIIGAPSEDDPINSGAVYVYEHEGAGWVLDQKIRLADLETWAALGFALGADGDRIVASAIGSYDAGFDAGSVYVYDPVDQFPGTPFCFGDGSGASCPCGNFDAGDSGCLNGSGRGAELAAIGSASYTEDELSLTVEHMPVGMPGLIFVGNDQVNGGFGLPIFDGLLCVGGSIERGPLFITDSAGTASLDGPVGAIDGAVIQPGSTVYFQAFFRDTFTSVCGEYANLSNGVGVTFLP